MIKLIEAHFDEESGTSFVTLDTDLGKFYGYAFLNKEEDAEIASAYFGCELAEMEATLQYYDKKRYLLAQGLEALYSFRVDLKRNAQYNSESFEVQLLDRRINQKENQKRIYDVMIKNLKNAIKTRPEQRIENIKLVNQILEKNKENKDKE
jgi:hypothetical protein